MASPPSPATRPVHASRLVWLSLPTLALALAVLLLLRVRGGEDPAARLEFQARRADLVEQLQKDLALESEAEKSAVLAVTDAESEAFASQARAASTKVEEGAHELDALLAQGGTDGEKELMSRFKDAFVEYRRVDENLLALAVKNSNIKAYELAYGPAAGAVSQMNEALDRLVARERDTPVAKQALPLALGAETGALRIQTLLAPHIAEEADAKMDAMEATMAKDDAAVKQHLAELARLPALKDDADLRTAVAQYAEFGALRTRILALSRENTNVRSLSISLNEKRKVTQVCESMLEALLEAIRAEPVPGARYGKPPKPR